MDLYQGPGIIVCALVILARLAPSSVCHLSTMSLLCRRQFAARVVFSPPYKFTFASNRFISAFNTKYENILTSRPEPGVALVTLNRPKALNALNIALFGELKAALRLIDADKEIGAIVITGSEKAFAGACARERFVHSHSRLEGCLSSFHLRL